VGDARQAGTAFGENRGNGVLASPARSFNDGGFIGNRGAGPGGPHPAASREVSQQGLEFIARFEGFRGKLYNDQANNATIGFGHLVHRGPINGSEPEEFRAGLKHRVVGVLCCAVLCCAGPATFHGGNELILGQR
jgi:hypothetical protein